MSWSNNSQTRKAPEREAILRSTDELRVCTWTSPVYRRMLFISTSTQPFSRSIVSPASDHAKGSRRSKKGCLHRDSLETSTKLCGAESK